jgi:hypothetical protein
VHEAAKCVFTYKILLADCKQPNSGQV